MPGKRRRESKLDKHDIELIIALWRGKVPQRAIAARLNITQARVSQIVSPPDLSRGLGSEQ